MTKFFTGCHKLCKKGHLFLCIGEELRKFEIPIEYLSYEELVQLLRESAEFEDPLEIKIVDGPLQIKSCTVERFIQVLKDIEEKRNH
ncbi:hypothetical protein LINGRAHAP2_LOCUS29621 [Linum grandiflorum]